MLLLSVDYFYSVTLRRGGGSDLNVTMMLGVPKSVWRCSLRGHLQIDFGTLNVIMTLGVGIQPMTLYNFYTAASYVLFNVGTDKYCL